MSEGARIYYSQWETAFARHGLVVHPAVGDHEIGDNPWDTARRRSLVTTYRDAWAAGVSALAGFPNVAFLALAVEFEKGAAVIGE